MLVNKLKADTENNFFMWKNLLSSFGGFAIILRERKGAAVWSCTSFFFQVGEIFGKDDENNVQIIFWVKKDKALSSCLIVLKQKKNTSETLFCTNQSNERDNQCYINVVWNNNSALIFKKYAYVRYSFLKNLVLLDLTNIYKIVRIDYKPKNTTFVCKKFICYVNKILLNSSK